MNNRNYGIDLLRIFSMFLIVTLHVMGHGGILGSVVADSINYEIAWFIEIAAYCAVNCYALISGYVGIDSKFKCSNIIYLWFQVVFYSVGCSVVFGLVKPDSVGIGDVLHAFFPVVYEKYWYFTAYFCMFFFIPMLNHVINTMKQEQLKKILLCIFFFFSLVTTWRNEDVFNTGFGYSVLWLGALYFVGAYIKRYVEVEKYKTEKMILAYLLCVVLTWGSKYLLHIFIRASIISANKERMLVNYTSPTIFVAAVALLLLFSKVKVKKARKIVDFLRHLHLAYI